MKLKNATLKNKLRNYSLLSGSLLAAGAANGQIIYHAVKPAVVLADSSSAYSLDLNGDGDTDFVLSEFKATNTVRAGISFRNNLDSIAGSVLKANSRKFGYPSVMASGSVIGASLNWFNKAAMKHNPYYPPIFASSYVFAGSYGKWKGGETNKYAGLKIRVINVDTTTYYGWARCTVAATGTSMSISGYAFQSVPDSSINAGDTDVVIVSGIKNNPLQNLDVYSFGKNIVVKYPNASRDGMTIIVRDIHGREIQEKQTNNEMYEFYLQNVASGIYTVTIQSKETEITHKVSIQ